MEANNTKQEELQKQISNSQKRYIQYHKLLTSSDSTDQIAKIYKEDYLPSQEAHQKCNKYEVKINKSLLTEIKSLPTPPPKMLQVLKLFTSITHNHNPQNMKDNQVMKEMSESHFKILDSVNKIDHLKKEVCPNILEACDRYIKDNGMDEKFSEKMSQSGEVLHLWSINVIKYLKVAHYPESLNSEEEFQKAIVKAHNKNLEYLKKQQEESKQNGNKIHFDQDYSSVNPI